MQFFGVILPEHVEVVVLINSTYFYLPPPKHVNLFTISVKNQARLTSKIVCSNLWVFTAFI